MRNVIFSLEKLPRFSLLMISENIFVTIYFSISGKYFYDLNYPNQLREIIIDIQNKNLD